MTAPKACAIRCMATRRCVKGAYFHAPRPNSLLEYKIGK
jgi:hypothetical protein